MIVYYNQIQLIFFNLFVVPIKTQNPTQLINNYELDFDYVALAVADTKYM